MWNAKPEHRHLPVWWEYLNIRALTRGKDWTESQRKMMHVPERHYGGSLSGGSGPAAGRRSRVAAVRTRYQRRRSVDDA